MARARASLQTSCAFFGSIRRLEGRSVTRACPSVTQERCWRLTIRGCALRRRSERLIEKLISEEPERRAAARKPRIIRVFKDYRLFINTINSACGQLRESGMNVRVESSEFENGVDIMIRVTQK